jgi:CRISPR-associated protein Cmr5
MAQKRAKYALQKVIEHTNKLSKEEKEKFGSFASGAPSMILQNGFGQTIAFWLAKGNEKGTDKHTALFDISVKWLSLKEADINNLFASKTDPRQFMHELFSMKQTEYLSAQNEILALLEWVKRFANADLS